MRGPVRAAAAIGVGVAVVSLAVAVWAAASRLEASRSPSGDGGGIRVTARVSVRTLERTVATRGVTGFDAGEPLVAARSGRVTRVWVSTGSVLRSGDRVLEIDGRPMVAIEATRPFWRDLELGQSGLDVTSLQEVLHAAGYLAVEPDGEFGASTRSALRAWQVDHRFPDADGVLRLDDWLVADWPQRVGEVIVSVGHFVSPGSELFVPTARRASVTIELPPSDRLLVHRGDPVRVEIAATGTTITGTVRRLGVDPVTRDDGSIFYTGNVAVGRRLDAPEGTQVAVSIVVDRAERVLAVPLASLVSDGAGGPAVRRVEPDGSVRTVAVELGLSEGAWVEVASGLEPNDTVLVAHG